MIAVFAGFGAFAAALLLAILVHEFSHAFVAARFGVQTRQLRLLPFGAEIDIDCAYLATGQRVLVLLAGSFGNIFFALVAGGILWIIPGFFVAVEYVIIANAFPAILNLLPIYPLDGGKILYVLAASKDRQRADKLVKLLYLVSGAFFVLLAVYSSLIAFNPAVILLCAVMLFTFTFEFKSTSFFSKINASVKTGHKIVEVAVNSEMTLFEIFKLSSSHNFTKFVVTDKKDTTFYENRLEEMLLEYSSQTKLKDIRI